jgi:acyl-CoA thioesterase-1
VFVFVMMFAPVLVLASQPTILVLGDSISSAYGIDKEQGWVALLQQRLATEHPAWRVVNASVSGDTTRTGLNRLSAALAEHRPTILIVQLGGNDGLRGLPLSEIETSLKGIIDLALADNVQIVLTSLTMPPNYGARYNQDFQAIFSALAEDFQLPLAAGLMDGFATEAGMMQEDRIHPSAAAQPALLEAIWPNLAPLLQ